MTIFDVIGGILFTKKKDLLNNVDDARNMQPFLVNRWVSMHSPTEAKIINETVNRYGHVFEDKADLYKFLVNVLPQYRFKRIDYIKKKKNEVA
jgi:hypothetical protein